MKLENSETLQCLINAYAGESQARNRYTYYAKTAKNEGYEKISEVFLNTAENEKEHAKLFMKYIPQSEHRKVTGEYPIFLGNTMENLMSAANSEKEEWEVVYKRSAQIAKEEGFDDIAELFNKILEIEKHHSHRYQLLLEQLENKSLFKKEERIQWLCRECGHIQISKMAPEKCPVCSHSQGYFEIFLEKF